MTRLKALDISYAGSSHHVTRTAVKVGKTWVALYDAHLLSPRVGLHGVRHRDFEALAANDDARYFESTRLAGYIRQERGPVLLTGDLNAPVQSLVCRNLFAAGLRDAFCDAGLGYGYSYGQFTKARFPYVRIDHIMFNKRLAAVNCRVGNAVGSDHSPVVADIVVLDARR
jgi:endonuclease/exonuclease/phosphatase (EEP) superfamily protein YafD